MATQHAQRERESERVWKTRIEIGTVMAWYKAGHFKTDAEARGAFELAYQQGMDGMGASPADWMGMTKDEFDAWIRSSALPKRPKR